MNIKQAKAIPLARIMESIGCKPVKERNHKSTYLSPLRDERTPSFHVDHSKNIWYDFGIGEGGTIVELACAYLNSHQEACTIPDALRWIENMSGSAAVIKPVATVDYSQQNSSLVLKSSKALKHPALIRYLEKRGIPENIAAHYIAELRLHNKESKKDFFALGFPNEGGGYEIRNQFFKGCVGPKSISFIRGLHPKPEGLHIFEGFMDYVSAITSRNLKRFDEDTIVLNSLSCLRHATPYIKNYGYHVAYTWMDNDPAGQKGTMALAEFFRTEKDLQHKPMNNIYLPHKDVNAWHMNNLSLSLG